MYPLGSSNWNVTRLPTSSGRHEVRARPRRRSRERLSRGPRSGVAAARPRAAPPPSPAARSRRGSARPADTSPPRNPAERCRAATRGRRRMARPPISSWTVMTRRAVWKNPTRPMTTRTTADGEQPPGRQRRTATTISGPAMNSPDDRERRDERPDRVVPQVHADVVVHPVVPVQPVHAEGHDAEGEDRRWAAAGHERADRRSSPQDRPPWRAHPDIERAGGRHGVSGLRPIAHDGGRRAGELDDDRPIRRDPERGGARRAGCGITDEPPLRRRRRSRATLLP